MHDSLAHDSWNDKGVGQPSTYSCRPDGRIEHLPKKYSAQNHGNTKNDAECNTYPAMYLDALHRRFHVRAAPQSSEGIPKQTPVPGVNVPRTNCLSCGRNCQEAAGFHRGHREIKRKPGVRRKHSSVRFLIEFLLAELEGWPATVRERVTGRRASRRRTKIARISIGGSGDTPSTSGGAICLFATVFCFPLSTLFSSCARDEKRGGRGAG